MRLHQLTGLARDELKKEHAEVAQQIAYLKDLLAHRSKLMGVVKTELLEVRQQFADERRTQIETADNDIGIEDLIPRAICTLTVSNTGYIKRLDMEQFRAQHRGGKGVVGMQTKEDDFVEHLFTACTHDYVLFFTNLGLMHWLKVYEIPEGGRASRGKAMINLFAVQPGETVRSLLTVDDVNRDDLYLVFVTRRGLVKKTRLSKFKHLRRKGIRALMLEEGDQLINVKLARDDQEIMIFSANGMACRFACRDARALGRSTRGVRGMRLKTADDAVVAMEIVDPNCDVLQITELGMGKRSNIGTGDAQQDREKHISGYRLTRRGSKGVTGIRLKEGDRVVGAVRLAPDSEIMLTTTKGQIVRFHATEVRVIGRTSQGVRVMNLNEGDRIVSVTLIAELEAEVAEAVGVAGVPAVVPETEPADGDGAPEAEEPEEDDAGEDEAETEPEAADEDEDDDGDQG